MPFAVAEYHGAGTRGFRAAPPGDNRQKWLLATAGFSIMAVLVIWL